jgi:hypothetical protein
VQSPDFNSSQVGEHDLWYIPPYEAERNEVRPSQIVVVLILATALCPAQDGAITRITLRYVNGKNGKPMRDEQTNVWTSDNKPFSRLPGSNGRDLILEFTQTRPLEIGVMPNYLFDCRFELDGMGGRNVNYSFDEIVTHGVVGVNLCGKITVAPTPGVLIVFVRPRTFREKWDL